MRRTLLGFAALLLLAGTPLAQPAQAPGIAWTSFTDPTEGAFTVQVPQGWQVAGGVKRLAPSEAPSWVTAVSPDNATEMFLNDPNVGFFSLPNPAIIAWSEGAQVPGLHRPMTVMRYRPGADYAALYGTRALAAVCANVQLRSKQPRPDVEDGLRATVSQSTQLDGGMATFTCNRDGRSFSAAVIAGTVLFAPTGVGGVWKPEILVGFRTPVGNEAQTMQVLEHMLGSFKVDPQWKAAINQAEEQEGAQMRQQAAARAAAQAPIPQAPYAGLAPVMTPGLTGRPATTIPGLGGNCDDLQQRRICNINDGHLVSSGGCLVCVGP